MRKAFFVICPLLLLVLAFRSAETLFEKPSHFPEPLYAFGKKPVNSAQIQLGRALFYDPVLSRDSSQSCASCHSPYNAFAHTDHALSHGIEDRIGTRNAPALMNLAWQPIFMWDGAVNHLDVQALAPISNALEMDENLPHVLSKLQHSTLYPALFKRAFGTNEITGERMLLALAQFQLSLVSAGSKYDSVQLGQSHFTEQQQHGYTIFKQHCNSCHTEPLFTNYAFMNNGLAPDTSLNDIGRMHLTQRASDSLKFKVPSLRNIEFTYPYMHDGRFNRLSEVLNHYTQGIQKSPTLAPQLNQLLPLNSVDRVDLIAFLLTLSDRRFLFDPSHAYPKDLFAGKPTH
ncbi:MAG: hypothetical protein RLZZ543_1256 [Bacteroidota bacterium]